MNINLDEKNIISDLRCLRIEMNAKPDLMSKFINNESSLVLIVDMVNGFCKEGALASERCERIVQNIENMLKAVPEAQKVFIRDVHPQSAVEFKWFPPHCCDEKECAVVDELKAFKAMDLPKNSTNGFFSLIKKIPDLSFYTNIIVAGVCTDICVMQLSLALRAYLNETNSNSNVIVFTDLVETYNSNLHNADLMNMFSLKLMEQSGVQIFKKLL